MPRKDNKDIKRKPGMIYQVGICTQCGFEVMIETDPEKPKTTKFNPNRCPQCDSKFDRITPSLTGEELVAWVEE